MIGQTHIHPLPPGAVCPHEECHYLRGHSSARCSCGQTRYAITTDWNDYHFGHSGGHVWFLTACPTCGRVCQDFAGSTWTAEQLAEAAAFIQRCKESPCPT